MAKKYLDKAKSPARVGEEREILLNIKPKRVIHVKPIKIAQSEY